MRFLTFIKEEQEITSAATSIPQVAAALKKIPWNPGTVNLDIGGGKFDIGTDYLKSKNVLNMVYDPYNRSSEHNNHILQYINDTPPDTITVNNVLNVIKEPEARASVIKMAAKYIKPGGHVYFSVYYDLKKQAGISKSKDGKPLSWQNHFHTKDYVDEIKKYFSNVKIWKDIIVASK